MARRRAKALFDLCAGFVYSQILFACVQLDLFAILASGPKTAAALSLRCGLPLDGMVRLLDAAAGLQLVTRRSGGRYGLGTLGAAMAGNQAVCAMVAHHALLYADLRDPLALLRGETQDAALAAYWPYATGQDVGQTEAGSYSALMAASQDMIAEQILDAYDVRRHRCLLDIGGGTGAFAAAALRRAPGLRAMLLDLPAVIAQARPDPRIQCIPGDFHNGELPVGADLATLVRVIHDHDDAQALRLLRAVRQALPAGGTLLLAEPMAESPGAESIGSYFSFYLLAMGSGRPRSGAELQRMLREAGFAHVRNVQTSMPLLTRLIIAGVAV